MRVEELETVIRAQPFRPFHLMLANAQRLYVDHPEWIFISPGRRTVVWADKDDRLMLLDIARLLGVESDTPGPGRADPPYPNGAE
jgi:hypothetical protein